MSPRQRRLRRRQRRGRGAKRGLLVLAGLMVLGAFAGAVGVIGYVVAVASSAPDIAALRPVDQGANSVVYASNGKRLGFIENDELRQPLETEELPPVLR